MIEPIQLLVKALGVNQPRNMSKRGASEELLSIFLAGEFPNEMVNKVNIHIHIHCNKHSQSMFLD